VLDRRGALAGAGVSTSSRGSVLAPLGMRNSGVSYHASWISVLAYTNRPLYPNGDAAAQGKVPKLLL
jgi:hypothetical protein